MRLHHLIIPIALFAATTAHAQVAPPGSTAPLVDVTGTYASTWGPMTLHQDGAHVTGSYTYHGGTIDGTLDGNTLRFTWHEDDGSGRGELVRAADGGLVGSWGTGDNDSNGGLWRLTPATAASLASSPTPTNVDASAASATGPTAGAWSFEVNVPVDAMFTPNQTLIGVGGVELGLGKRLTDNWYLGVTGGIEGLVTTNFEATNTPDERLRGGIEARYTFLHGTGSASVNDGPAFDVPRTTWVGADAGIESLGNGNRGAYSDLSLGTDWWLGQTQVGMYLKAGVSIEPADAFGTTPPSDSGSTTGTSGLAEAPTQDGTPATSVMSTYVGMGWRVAFN